MQWSLGQEMSQQLWEGKSTKFLCLLDSYSDPVQGAPALCIVFHSSRFCQEPRPHGRGGTGNFMRHSRLTSSPTLPCTSPGGSGRSVTQGAKQQSTGVPCSVPAAPLLPIIQMETGIILGRTANEGALNTDDRVQVQSKLQEAEKEEEGHTKQYRIFPIRQEPLCN